MTIIKVSADRLRQIDNRPNEPTPTLRAVMEAHMQEIKHGTYGGYQVHRKRGEEACDDCRKAANEYSRTIRQTSTSKRSMLRSQRLTNRALSELRRRHLQEYREIREALKKTMS